MFRTYRIFKNFNATPLLCVPSMALLNSPRHVILGMSYPQINPGVRAVPVLTTTIPHRTVVYVDTGVHTLKKKQGKLQHNIESFYAKKQSKITSFDLRKK